MSFAEFFSRQAASPSGWFGRWLMPLVFDKGNAELNRMMKRLLEVRAGDRILEIGVGTGKLMRELTALLGDGRIDGVELSETMASMARKKNRAAIAQGRAAVLLGDFNEMELAKGAYDIVCSCNTLYFWPDPLFTLRKAHAILKPRGRLVLAFEEESRLKTRSLSQDVFRLYSHTEIEDLLRRSGFTEGAQTESKNGKEAGLCCVCARKPE